MGELLKPCILHPSNWGCQSIKIEKRKLGSMLGIVRIKSFIIYLLKHRPGGDPGQILFFAPRIVRTYFRQAR